MARAEHRNSEDEVVEKGPKATSTNRMLEFK
jgi:hypothetical protein